MAVQIDVATKTPGGADIPAGSVVVFSTSFPAVKLQMKMKMEVYKDLQTIKDLGQPIEGGVDGLASRHIFEYDLNGFSLIDQAHIDNKAKEVVEAVVGVGNTTNITKDQLQPPTE